MRLLVVEANDFAETVNRLLQSAKLAREAAQLEMRVGLAWVNLDRAFEVRRGFGVLTALAVEQAELIVRFVVARVDGCGFEVATEALPLTIG